MNWTWHLRSGDGGMNGLEFTRATTGGGFDRVLVHAAPAQLQIEVRRADGEAVVAAEVEREGDYSPMTLLTIYDDVVRRAEVWPGSEHHGLPVLLAGGEVGILTDWQHADDHSWWRWRVEFSNHTGRPDDWSPPTENG
jgi:hypothetical protein